IDAAWKAAILAQRVELPLERRQRFIEAYGLPEYDAEILTGERALSDYFEQAVQAYGGDPKKVSNYLMNDILRLLNESGKSATDLRLTPAYLAEILKLADAGTINTSTAKALLQKVEESGRSPREIVEAEGLAKVSDAEAIRAVCREVIAENPNEVETYRKGKVTLIAWFVGQVMKKMRGKADPTLTRQILEDLLREG
ncbi:MAG: Asp-tRNA(Asn)/Glu-tRNA(Gln) amidotransferase GatCAB subunit B, partial [Thermanaerothrix sp.]|nr:Asp-tRNA(Asn)/Glu-tRNA(Gln) amidotransferase GatCAB subunit B [Thermanaerothrix sp.]